MSCGGPDICKQRAKRLTYPRYSVLRSPYFVRSTVHTYRYVPRICRGVARLRSIMRCERPWASDGWVGGGFAKLWDDAP